MFLKPKRETSRRGTARSFPSTTRSFTTWPSPVSYWYTLQVWWKCMSTYSWACTHSYKTPLLFPAFPKPFLDKDDDKILLRLLAHTIAAFMTTIYWRQQFSIWAHACTQYRASGVCLADFLLYTPHSLHLKAGLAGQLVDGVMIGLGGALHRRIREHSPCQVWSHQIQHWKQFLFTNHKSNLGYNFFIFILISTNKQNESDEKRRAKLETSWLAHSLWRERFSNFYWKGFIFTAISPPRSMYPTVWSQFRGSDHFLDHFTSSNRQKSCFVWPTWSISEREVGSNARFLTKNEIYWRI